MMQKITKICVFWTFLTFWPVIQLISHLFKIQQKSCELWAMSDFEKMVY